ncbi:peptide/nickel transport system permease protein [Octadecabacter temperatus]|uniref:Oligopeptide transport system permease protein OppB n=1 Tax=Octadecabacter temperatus TaxID=1458307 RepID=A0A0K0Y4X7_9RHOB|nr:ABC transporter permease [Octadecabacter temperatus]AKS45931.1 Oligopeptide transport system permease protein OppB [Octadecabacter temperatus]SIO03775.1 peptide/nickel transport system permease protein [Octadecabacter temperatus]
MGLFILRRLGVMLLTALCLTFIVFWLTNLYPKLEVLAKTQGNFRMSDEAVTSYLDNRGYTQSLPVKYGQWLGVVPGYVIDGSDGETRAKCEGNAAPTADTPRFCGIIQGNWGFSTVAKDDVATVLPTRLGNTGKLMFWVMVVMVPGALIIGVLAGMREGSRTDRSLSTVSIVATATPEYVSGVILIALFATPLFGMQYFKGTATSAMDDITFNNFFLPVITIALYGMGYIARMTRASMTEVMTAQYVRTARLKGVSFPNIVMKHALRNALIAPFTVIMLQVPWLLNGVVIVETLFNYKGFGWELVRAASNNDIEMLLGVSVISVIVVLTTQLISDIGYVFLNPRIRIS